jgi:hypothetical protein
MIVAIMQPYFFPYIGYFQLIARADVFVFYDDVKYSKGGWVNRNYVRRDGLLRLVTLPILQGSAAARIDQRSYRLAADSLKVLRQVEAAYRKAPHFHDIFPMIKEIMAFDDANVATFNINLLSRIVSHLGLKARLIRSSDIPKDQALTGQDRVIDICRRLGATHYLNPIGGRDLYQAESFRRAGMRLSFLQANVAALAPFASIIDMLMVSDEAAIRAALTQYCLYPAVPEMPHAQSGM